MSARHVPPLDSLRFQLLATLEQYDAEVESLVLGWQAEQDLAKYQEVSRCIDQVRNLSAAEPHLAVNWVMLLISHTELMQKLWLVCQGIERVDLKMHLLAHAECTRSFAAKCRRQLLESTQERNGR